MINREDCKYFYQHYGYSERDVWIHKVACEHCLCNIKTKTCKNCPFYEPCEVTKPEIFDIVNCFLRAERKLNEVKEGLKKKKII